MPSSIPLCTPLGILNTNPIQLFASGNKNCGFISSGAPSNLDIGEIPQASAPKASTTTASAPQANVTTSTKTVSKASGSTVSAAGKTQTSTAANEKYEAAPYKDQKSASTSTSASTPAFAVHAYIGYDLSLEEIPDNTTVWGASVHMLFDQYLTDMFYCGLGAGFSIGESIAKVDPYKTTSTAYNILFPVYIGFSPIDFLDIDTGPSFNWLVGGGTVVYNGSKKEYEYNYNDDKDLKHFAPTWRFSVRIYDFIQVGVNIGLKKNSGASMTFGITF